jgi:hypothetical protein
VVPQLVNLTRQQGGSGRVQACGGEHPMGDRVPGHVHATAAAASAGAPGLPAHTCLCPSPSSPHPCLQPRRQRCCCRPLRPPRHRRAAPRRRPCHPSRGAAGGCAAGGGRPRRAPPRRAPHRACGRRSGTALPPCWGACRAAGAGLGTRSPRLQSARSARGVMAWARPPSGSCCCSWAPPTPQGTLRAPAEGLQRVPAWRAGVVTGQ